MNTPPDAQLVAFVQSGEESAFDELHQRHLAVARRTARVMADNDDHADDIVAQAFEQVRVHLLNGTAPALPFAVLVRTVIRRVALDQYRSGETPTSAAGAGTEDGLAFADEALDDGHHGDPATAHTGAEFPAARAVPIGPRVDAAPSDAEIERMNERQLIRAAYEALPERWQRVLWRTEMEERPPADLAPELGSSPNSVAALAFRAREGLRQAYLAVNHASAANNQCRQLIPRLAAYVRQTLPEAEDVAVAIHMDTCGDCRARRDELLLLVSDLRALLVAALIGMTPVARPAVVPVPAGPAETLAPVAAAAGGRSRVRPRRIIQVAATTLVSAAAAVGVAFAVVTTMSPSQPDEAFVAPEATSPAVEAARSSVASQSVPVTSPFAEDEEIGEIDEDIDTGEAAEDAVDGTPSAPAGPADARSPGSGTSGNGTSGARTPADAGPEDAEDPSSGSATAAPSGPPTSTPSSTPARQSAQPEPSTPPAAPPAVEPPADEDPAEPTPPSGSPETPAPDQTGLCVIMRLPLLCP